MTFSISRWVPHGRTATILGLIVVVLLAAFVRFDGLGTPNTFIADEGFYAPDGCLYVLSSHQCDRSAEASPEHPPLGKWLIGLGIKATSFTPQGWRTAPAIAGTLTVALLFLLALRLFGSRRLCHVHRRSARAGSAAYRAVANRDARCLRHVVRRRGCAVRGARLSAPIGTTRARLAARGRCGGGGGGSFEVVGRARAGGGRGSLPGATRRSFHTKARVCRDHTGPGAAGRVRVDLCGACARKASGGSLVTWQPDSRRSLHRQVTMWRDQTGGFVPSAYQSPPWSWPLLKRPEVHYASVANHQIREVSRSDVRWFLQKLVSAYDSSRRPA